MDKHIGSVSALAVLPDGRIVSGSADKTVKLWNPVTGEVNTFAAYAPVTSLACDPKQRRAFAGLANGEIVFLEPEA